MLGVHFACAHSISRPLVRECETATRDNYVTGGNSYRSWGGTPDATGNIGEASGGGET